jgi:uncharacterized protein YeaO (DUF488 family)
VHAALATPVEHDGRVAPRGTVHVRRVYEAPDADDGARVLVDRLWPRGLSKQDAVFDEWYRDIAPSAELRTWYAHAPERFDEFAARYRAELARPEQAGTLAALRRLRRERGLTLLTATKALELSNAAVLADVLAADQ